MTLPPAIIADLERAAAVAQLKEGIGELTPGEMFALAALGGANVRRTEDGLRAGPCGIFRINGAWQIIHPGETEPRPERKKDL